MRNLMIISLLALVILFNSCAKNRNKDICVNKEYVYEKMELDTGNGYWPPNGFISSDSLAFKYGVLILRTIYGNRVLDNKPFKLFLYNDSIWILEGTLPEGFDGGVPHIEFEKRNARVIKVSHGK